MADTNEFTISLVTPERVLIEGRATEVVLRTGEGDAAFLPGHTPLVGTLQPGVVRVVGAEGEEQRVAVHGGFVQVELGVAGGDDESAPGSRVTLLVGVAELAEEIDVDRARLALDAAEARLSELVGAGSRSPGGDEGEEADPELVEAEAELRRAQVRLEAADAPSGSTSGATSGATA
jgi:F-type H+-transporting ATPase subunit epsilon